MNGSEIKRLCWKMRLLEFSRMWYRYMKRHQQNGGSSFRTNTVFSEQMFTSCTFCRRRPVRVGVSGNHERKITVTVDSPGRWPETRQSFRAERQRLPVSRRRRRRRVVANRARHRSESQYWSVDSGHCPGGYRDWHPGRDSSRLTLRH